MTQQARGSGDRTVHGRTADGGEIVRYDRAGKWYVEWRDTVRHDVYSRPRRSIGVLEAAALAKDGDAYIGKPGGSRFDAAVLR